MDFFFILQPVSPGNLFALPISYLGFVSFLWKSRLMSLTILSNHKDNGDELASWRGSSRHASAGIKGKESANYIIWSENRKLHMKSGLKNEVIKLPWSLLYLKTNLNNLGNEVFELKIQEVATERNDKKMLQIMNIDGLATILRLCNVTKDTTQNNMLMVY